MKETKNIISIIMFMLYTAFLVFFVVALLVRVQSVAGSFYFLMFATSLAFAFLEKRYGANFRSYYRFSLYISDIVNVCALISLLRFKINVWLFASALALFVASFVVDLFSHNRKKLQSKINVVVLICNSCFMFSIFPFFYDSTFSIAFAISAVVFACAVLVLKVVLALSRVFDESFEQKNELVEKLKMAQEEQVE